MDIPYEYCAYRYLELWEKAEKPLHSAMSGMHSAVQIRNALSYYKVARNFKGLKEDNVAENISKKLLEVDGSRGSYSENVEKLADSFKVSCGQYNLSAASKLLWLRYRSPYLVYDKRAVTALNRLSNKLKNADYTSYCEAWLKEYEKRSGEISSAAHGLVNLPRKYTAAFTLTDNDLIKIVHSKWFIERVFDIYLWEIGAAKQRNNES
ncbi:MAG TPA: hypothetical protein VGC87_16095 [Pyrinomonadaceae bacterium]|jgi:hypothetical protein